MSEVLLDYRTWNQSSPFQTFLKLLDALNKELLLNPDTIIGTDKEKMAKWGFSFLCFDIITMYRYIGEIMRRLNRDFLILEKREMKPQKEPEDDFFGTLHRTHVDFLSLIVFLNILMEKAARLLVNISKGNTPSDISFNDWKKDIRNNKITLHQKLRELILNTPWFDEIRNIRVKYAVHHNYSMGGIIDYNTTQLVSHLRRKNGKQMQMLYHIRDIQRISDSILTFFNDLGDYISTNFDSLPIRIEMKK